MFFHNISIAFSQVLVLILLATVGFVCHAGGLFTEEVSRKCSGLLFYIVTPCVIAYSFSGLSHSGQTLRLLWLTLIANLIFYTVCSVLIIFLFNRSKAGAVYKYASMYGNVGYMGIPLSQALIGPIGVFICSISVFIFNAFAFTHGAAIMGGRKSMKPIKLLLNPGTIGILLGIPLYIWSGIIPNVILQPIEHLANLNTPLAMLMLGTYLASAKLSEAFKTAEIYFVALIKLILLPAVTLPVCVLLGLRGELLCGITLMSCVPSATNTVIFAAQFDQDVSKAGICPAFTAILSIITIPVWLALAQIF